MSASVFLIARAYPALFLLPVLNIPIVNGVVLRIGTDIVHGVCWRLPVYFYNNVHKLWRKDLVQKEEEYHVFTVSADPEFPDYESIEML